MLYNHSSHNSQFFLHPNKINLISVKSRTLELTKNIESQNWLVTVQDLNIHSCVIWLRLSFKMRWLDGCTPEPSQALYVWMEFMSLKTQEWNVKTFGRGGADRKVLGGRRQEVILLRRDHKGLMPCKPAWSTCSNLNSSTLSAQTLKLLPKFETHELVQNITHMKPYHKYLGIKMTWFVIWFVSVNMMALSTQTFAVKYHNFI